MSTPLILEGLGGKVTAITGFEKGSGKTTFLSLALPHARRVGPVAVFTIGVDGRLKADRGASTDIRVEPGDVVMTTEAFARASEARLEVLDTIPGRTALGRLFLGRARRAGSVTLVGSEHLSALDGAVERVRAEGWASSVLIDGAVNRITQVSALSDVQFVFTVQADRSNLARAAARVRAVAAMADLPLDDGSEAPAGLEANRVHRIDGPLTAETLQALPSGLQCISVAEFTKIFLEPKDLLRAMSRVRIEVRRRLPLLGFVVTLRDVRCEAFTELAGTDAASRTFFNPWAPHAGSAA